MLVVRSLRNVVGEVVSMIRKMEVLIQKIFLSKFKNKYKVEYKSNTLEEGL